MRASNQAFKEWNAIVGSGPGACSRAFKHQATGAATRTCAEAGGLDESNVNAALRQMVRGQSPVKPPPTITTSWLRLPIGSGCVTVNEAACHGGVPHNRFIVVAPVVILADAARLRLKLAQVSNLGVQKVSRRTKASAMSRIMAATIQ